MTKKAATIWARRIVRELNRTMPVWERDGKITIKETVGAILDSPWAVLETLEDFADDDNLVDSFRDYLKLCVICGGMI